MSRAVIVVGNELRFLRNARHLAKHVRGLGHHVRILRAAYKTPDELARSLWNQFALARGRPLLLAYFGHGIQMGWAHALEDGANHVLLLYNRLLAMIEHHNHSLLIINECCHAGALGGRLYEAGIDPTRVGVIAASPSAEVSKPGTANRVVQAWSSGLAYRPIWEELPPPSTDPPITVQVPASTQIVDREVRWGTNQFDQLYFAAPRRL